MRVSYLNQDPPQFLPQFIKMEIPLQTGAAQNTEVHFPLAPS